MFHPRSLLLGACMAAGLSASAQAAVLITSTAGAPDPGFAAGETLFITFDGGLEPGVTLTGGQIVSGSSTNHYAAPAGDATDFLAVGADGSETAELDFASFLGDQAVKSFSFYWGSIDAFNVVQLLNSAGAVIHTVTGAQLPPATGDQVAGLTNRRVTFTLTGADQDLTGLRVSSSRPAFELDSIGFSFASVVPEPATWSILVGGFMAAGWGLRRRRGSAFA